MSKAKDRARAKLGYIFRDGKLWLKTEWEKLHPKRRHQPCPFPCGSIEPAPYFCSKCARTHRIGTKIYEAHKEVIA